MENSTENQVTKDMTLAQILEIRPDAVEKLTNIGLGCVGCHFAQFETLEQGAQVHGLDVDELVEILNSDEDVEEWA